MRFYIGKDIAGKIQVGKAGGENWKGGYKSIGRIINKWNIFHAEHTMTGSEEMSGGYGWKRD